MFQLGSCANLLNQSLGPGMKSYKKKAIQTRGLECRKEAEVPPKKGMTPTWTSELLAASPVLVYQRVVSEAGVKH